MSVSAIIDIINKLPLADLDAALANPTSLSVDAQVVQDIIETAMPGLDGIVVNILVQLFVTWVYSSGGGTISADPNPEVDAQLQHGGGNLT